MYLPYSRLLRYTLRAVVTITGVAATDTITHFLCQFSITTHHYQVACKMDRVMLVMPRNFKLSRFWIRLSSMEIPHGKRKENCPSGYISASLLTKSWRRH